MKRRHFLKSSIALPLMINGMKISTLQGFNSISALNDSDRVLVLIQLNGGNDGLNSLIPLDQYDKLANLRSNVIIPETDIISLTNENGFHPALQSMANLFTNNKMNIIQDVGYPNQNRSHFRSIDIWNAGSSANEFETTGWIGRYLDSIHNDYPNGYPNNNCPDPLAINIGFAVHETCQGISSNFSTALVDPDNLANIIESEPGSIDLNTCYGTELDFVRQSISQNNAYSGSVSSASDLGNNLANYPDEDLAQQLKIVARLISGGLQTSIYTVNIGGFDTHANQVANGNTQAGTHANLLQTLSDAITAFQSDLEQLGVDQRVLGMTYSEFGRQIKSNNSLGTDHGTAAPLFVFGSCVNPTIIGSNYEIPDVVEDQAGVPMQYDFRSVYGSILMDWFDVEESQVQNLLFDDFQHLNIVQACTVNTDDPKIISPIQSYNYPNPFDNWTTIHFTSTGGNYKISIFDTLGHEIKVVSNRNFPTGDHQVQADLSAFPAGMYHYRIVSRDSQETKNLHKIR